MKVTLMTRDGQETSISSDTAPHDGEIIPCLRCGVCCTRWQPQLDPEEVSVVAQHLGLSTEEFQRDCIAEHPRRFGLHLLRRDEGHCLFLAYKNDEAECTINAFKPVACCKWT